MLVHELGHFAAFVAFRFPDPVLRYGSASWSGSGEFGRLVRAGDVEAAAAIVQPWQVAVGVAAGVIVTYLTVIACVLAVRRFGPGPLSVVLGVGLVTPLRWLGAIPILVSKLRGRLPFPIEHGRGLVGGAHGDPRDPSPSARSHLSRAGILVPRNRDSPRPEDPDRRPDAGGQRGRGWSLMGPVVGAADSSVKPPHPDVRAGADGLRAAEGIDWR